MRLWADKIVAVRTVRTIYRDGSTVIKLFDRDHSESEVLNEALNQALGEEMGLHVPAVLEVIQLDGKWAIRSTYVNGRTLQQLLDDCPGESESVLETLVALQLEVQARRCPQLPDLREIVDRQIQAADLDDALCEALCAELCSFPVATNVCHGELEPSNVIIADDGTPYLVDWSAAARGHAAADAAQTCLSFVLRGDWVRMRAYRDLYCAKTDTDQQEVEKWLAIVAAARCAQCRKAERAVLLQLAGQNEYKI